MAETSNLRLKLTEDPNTLFEDWRSGLDGNNAGENKSNMQKIDDWAGEIERTKYEKPSAGIPKTDLSASVQGSLNKADSVPEWALSPSKPTYTATEISDGTKNVSEKLSDINNKISDSASSTNRLVSASEMGDAIASVEAKQLYATNTQGSFGTKAALLSATVFYDAAGVAATPTKNDVAYILADESHDGKSAKYTIADVQGTTITWGFVITFSDSTFNQAQLDAINSGITQSKRSGYDSHVANSDIHVTAQQKTTWSAKQDAISDLTTIRNGAAAGASAVQPADNISTLTNDAGYLTLATLPVYDGGVV